MDRLFDALAAHAARNPDSLALDDGTSRLTYAALARRVAGFAETLAPSPGVLGLLGSNGADWVVAQLAGWLAGKTVVPLPPFFRPQQLEHIVRDAGIGQVIATPQLAWLAERLGVPCLTVSGREAGAFPSPSQRAGGQVIYTSGSAGRPKGVRLERGQIAWIGAALQEATGATRTDSYLSVLPLSLLLETISAIVIPVLAGARVYFNPGLAERVGLGWAEGVAAAFATVRPSSAVLVPELLAARVAELAASGAKAPDSLRFVAVGGAHVPPDLAEKAWRLGIPVHEGYGLSECASVVAVNRPGERKPGTVGRVLQGLSVAIDGDEIVVRGPSLMDGYLGGPPAPDVWRTGDIGSIDADGFLTVVGRRDNLLITSFGRNVSPEWIEALILDEPRFARCIVLGDGRPYLTAVLVPARAAEPWFESASREQVAVLVSRRCAGVPRYAAPRGHLVVTEAELRRHGAVTPNGRVRRRAVAELVAGRLDALYASSAEITGACIAS